MVVITALVEEADNVTVLPLTSLCPSAAINVTVTVPVGSTPPLGNVDTTAGFAITVETDWETLKLPNVTKAAVALPVRPSMSSVVSFAVKVTASAVVSVAVNVACPWTLVVPDTVVILEFPVPCRVTVFPDTGSGGEPDLLASR